ncbi:MAG: DUF4340 domain-containing protein [Solirubrobacterales bacterium]
MSNQKLGILAVVAAVMVFLAVITGRTSMGTRGKASGPAYLIQGLDTAGIDSIRVAEGDKEVKIRRQGQGSSQFVVEDMNYPADTKQINDLITKVLDIKTVDLYTSDVANHKELEVSEEKPRGSIKFFKPDGSLLTGIVIGKTRESGEGTYVREASSNDVYLTNESPYIRTRGLDYVNQEIVSVKGEDVNAVTVTTPDGSYTLRAQKGGGVLMDGLPADKKLKETDAKSVLTALQGLRFDDVNTPTQITGLTFDRKYVARMNDSTEYTLELAKKGEKTYLLASAVYTDPGKVTINPEGKDSPEELKKKETILMAQAGTQRFNLRHKNWVYTIPDWKAKSLLMSQSDLFEAEVKPAEAKTETSQAAPAAIPALQAVPAIEPTPAAVAPAPQAAEPNQPK